MEIKYTLEPDYEYECLTMLTKLISPDENTDNGYKSFNTFRNNVLSDPTQSTKEMENIFNQLETDAKEILSQLPMSEEKLRFYFTPFHENISLAAILIFAKPIFSLPEDERKPLLCRELLSCLFSFSELVDDANPPETENELFAYLERLPLSVEAKWNCMLFIHNFAEYNKEFTPVLEKAEKLLREKFSFYLPYIEREINKIKTNVSEQGVQWLGKRYRINPNAESFTIGVSLMQYNGIELRSKNAILDGCEKNITFRVGILVNSLFEQREKQGAGDENLLRSLKTLNDKNRLQILHLLKNCPLCGQEIAEQLGITPATVSHHMNDLAARNFVTLDRIGAKINYRLSSEGIQAFLNELQSSLL